MRVDVGFHTAAARASRVGFQRLEDYLGSARFGAGELRRIAIEMVDALAGLEVRGESARLVARRPWLDTTAATDIRVPLTGDALWSADEQQLLARSPTSAPTKRPAKLLHFLQALVSRDGDPLICDTFEARLGVDLATHAVALAALGDAAFTAVTSLDLSRLSTSQGTELLPLTIDHAKLLACELARRRIALLHILLHRPIPEIGGFRTQALTTTRFFAEALVAPARALHTIMGKAIHSDDTLESFVDRLVDERLLSRRATTTLRTLIHEILAERAATWTRHMPLDDLDQRCAIHVVATSTDLAQFHSKRARDIVGNMDGRTHREGAFGTMTFVEARLGIPHNMAAVLVGMSLLAACRTLDQLVSAATTVFIDPANMMLPGRRTYPEVALIDVVDALRCDGRLDRYCQRAAGSWIGTQSRDLVHDALASIRAQDPVYARAMLEIDPSGWITRA
jgi:hypothetical protein